MAGFNGHHGVPRCRRWCLEIPALPASGGSATARIAGPSPTSSIVISALKPSSSAPATNKRKKGANDGPSQGQGRDGGGRRLDRPRLGRRYDTAVRGCIAISSGIGSDIFKCLDMTFQRRGTRRSKTTKQKTTATKQSIPRLGAGLLRFARNAGGDCPQFAFRAE